MKRPKTSNWVSSFICLPQSGFCPKHHGGTASVMTTWLLMSERRLSGWRGHTAGGYSPDAETSCSAARSVSGQPGWKNCRNIPGIRTVFASPSTSLEYRKHVQIFLLFVICLYFCVIFGLLLPWALFRDVFLFVRYGVYFPLMWVVRYGWWCTYDGYKYVVNIIVMATLFVRLFCLFFVCFCNCCQAWCHEAIQFLSLFWNEDFCLGQN